MLAPSPSRGTIETGSPQLEPVLSVRKLTKSFPGGPAVLSGIDLDVRPGEAVALIGANGSGKSTFIRCLLRLIEPCGGDVRMFGLDVGPLHGRGLRRLRSRVGFVFQRHNLVLRLSALSNVIHGAQAHRSSPAAWYQSLAPSSLRNEAMACLERVGLADKAYARADALSGGQSQRVAIARMLMQQPDFVVADEPAASLDPKAGQTVMTLLRETTRERGLGLLFISHDLDHAVRFSDRIVGFAGGRVALVMPSAQVAASELRTFFHEPQPA